MYPLHSRLPAGHDAHGEQIVTGYSPFGDDPVLYVDYGFVPFNVYDYASRHSHLLSSHWTDYEVVNDPWLRADVVTSDDHVWLRQTQEVCTCSCGTHVHKLARRANLASASRRCLDLLRRPPGRPSGPHYRPHKRGHHCGYSP